jgi:hypothetical protein
MNSSGIIPSLFSRFRNHQLQLNLRDQRHLHQNLVWLESNLALDNPRWTTEFIANYLKSRYPEVWFQYQDLRSQYYRWTERERDKYRIRMVTEKHLCEDLVDYLREFV